MIDLSFHKQLLCLSLFLLLASCNVSTETPKETTNNASANDDTNDDTADNNDTNSDDETNADTSINPDDLLLQVKTQVKKSMLLSSASTSLRFKTNLHATSSWTSTLFSDAGSDGCAAMTSPKAVLQELENPDCTVSPIFDLNNLLEIMCAVTGSLSIDDDKMIEAPFDDSVTISQAVATKCGIEDAVGYDLPVVVSEVSDSDYYQRKVVATTSAERTMYVGSNGTTQYVSFYYDDSNGGGSYRGFYSNDTSSKIMLFELQTKGSSTVNFFRIYRDESVEPALVKTVGSNHDAGSSNKIRWTFSGDAGTENDIAIDMIWNKDSEADSLSTCVNAATFAASGTSADCGDYTAPSASAFDTLMDTILSTFTDQTADEFKAAFSSADKVSFTESTIESADATN